VNDIQELKQLGIELVKRLSMGSIYGLCYEKRSLVMKETEIQSLISIMNSLCVEGYISSTTELN